MIKRKMDDFLEQFFATRKEALLVTGARQTGKTSSIRQFGKSRFECFVEINFVEQPDAVKIFRNVSGAEELLLRLSAFAPKKLRKGSTLFFFDEVQECPEIATAVKFLVEEGSYRYALSGSLLGVELKDIRSVPVGFLAVKEMFPLDLEEFCEALGVQESVLESLRRSFRERVPVDPVVHEKMMKVFRLYLVVGGMPAAVAEYLASNDLGRVVAIQRSIIALYKKDIARYDSGNKLLLEEMFGLIPPELNAQNKRFVLKDAGGNLKFSRVENGFLWLRDAGVALPVYNVEEPRIPLLLSRSRNLFKLFQSDVGLLACQYANGLQLKILNGETDVNFGAVWENAAAQELRAHGFDLYYFNSKKQGELDFVVERDGAVLPLEIKSGKGYQRHNALKNVLGNPRYGIRLAFVFCDGNVASEGERVYLPIYMLMFLERETGNLGVYKVDLEGLK